MFGKYPTFWVIQKRFAAVKYFYVWNYPKYHRRCIHTFNLGLGFLSNFALNFLKKNYYFLYN